MKFGDLSRGEIIEYIWDFGDGNYSTQQNPVNQYALGGYYMVCLTVVNNYGIPNTYCDYIHLATSDEERCFADFFFAVDSASLTAEFVQTSHGEPDEFTWFFGDKTGSNKENPASVLTLLLGENIKLPSELKDKIEFCCEKTSPAIQEQPPIPLSPFVNDLPLEAR